MKTSWQINDIIQKHMNLDDKIDELKSILLYNDDILESRQNDMRNTIENYVQQIYQYEKEIEEMRWSINKIEDKIYERNNL